MARPGLHDKPSAKSNLSEHSLKSGYSGLVEFCKLVDQPLERFQKRIAKVVHGDAREIAAIVPRGNFKTTTAALLGLHHLLTEDHAAVTIGAASREQASICFARMQEFALHPAIEDFVTIRNLELRCEDEFGIPRTLNVVPAVGAKAHGLSSSLYIGDEVWAWKESAKLLEAMQTGLIKRPDAKLLAISTAADKLDSPLGRLRSRALALPNLKRKGAVIEASGHGLHWLEWSLPDDASLDNMREVKRVNPAAYIDATNLKRQREAVPGIEFAQFHANRWGVQEGAWLPAGAWQNCAGDAEIDAGEEVWVGVDIGGSRDASAVVIATSDLRVQAWTWKGEDSVLKVAAFLPELAERFAVREVAYDPWRFKSEALRLEEAGLPVVEFPQSHSRMIPASEGLYAVVVEGKLTHGNDEILNQHVANAVAKQADRGWRLVKSAAENQIDAAVAMSMAISRVEEPAERTQLIGWI